MDEEVDLGDVGSSYHYVTSPDPTTTIIEGAVFGGDTTTVVIPLQADAAYVTIDMFSPTGVGNVDMTATTVGAIEGAAQQCAPEAEDTDEACFMVQPGSTALRLDFYGAADEMSSPFTTEVTSLVGGIITSP